MNKSKGFTIIELLVVIAIIAVLAAVVLVNVTGYISKAKDAAIKTDIGNLATGMASCYSSTGAYTGCSANTTYVPAALATDINEQNGTGGAALIVNVDANGTVFCASAELATSTGDNAYVCTDSTGVTKSSATSTCGTTATACPN